MNQMNRSLVGRGALVERSKATLSNLLLAVWVVYPNLPMRWFARPILDYKGVISFGSFADDQIHGVNPLHVGWKHVCSAITRPYYVWAHAFGIAAALRRYVERNRAGNSTAEISAKSANVISVHNLKETK